MAEERKEEPQRGAIESSTTTGPPTEQRTQEGEQKSPPYNFGIAAIVLVLASLIFVVIMVVFAGLFKEATQVTAALGSLFTLMGTVVGTYFGIKSTQDRVLPLVRLLHQLCRFVGRPLGALDSGT